MNYGPINQAVGGFLGLLRLKNQGQNPQTVDSNLVPVIQYLPFLLGRPTFEDLLTTISVASNGLNVALAATAVPEGKLRVIHSVTATRVLAAAESLDATIVVAPSGTAPNQPIYPLGDRQSLAFVGAGDFWMTGYTSDLLVPQIMWSGARFALAVHHVAGTPMNVSIIARYSEFDY